MKRGLVLALGWIGALLWLAGPLIVIYFLTIEDGKASLIESEQVWVPVRGNSAETVEIVDIALVWSEVTPVVAPSWEGVITGIDKNNGEEISSGESLMSIDGIKRHVYHSEEPLWRSLGVSDVGRDAYWLNCMLRDSGYSYSNSDRITAATVRGIGSYSLDIGYLERQEVFDPGWVVYLPSPSAIIEKFELVSSQAAPVQGVVLFQLSPKLTDGVLVDVGSLEIPSADQGADEPTTGLDINPDSILTVMADESAMWGDSELELNDSRDHLSDTDLEAIGAKVGNGEQIVRGQITRGAKKGEMVVPSSAIFSTPEIEACVVMRSSKEAGARRIEISGEQSGNSIVSDGLAVGDDVLLSPPAVERKCK